VISDLAVIIIKLASLFVCSSSSSLTIVQMPIWYGQAPPMPRAASANRAATNAPGGRAARRVQSTRLHRLARITTWSYRYMQLFWEAEHKTVAVLLNNIAYPTFQL
jgi:hypothetical protein